MANTDDDFEDRQESDEQDEELLFVGGGQGTAKARWTIKAHNRRVLKSWKVLSETTQSDVVRCVEWLSTDAMRPIPRRCYPLKGKALAGIWAYEIGAGNRVYYRPNQESRVAIVYYAGPHPNTVPMPPKELRA